MTTSGTVAKTTIPVIDILDHSILRCGIAPAKINAEMLDTARKNLFYYTMYLANKGVNLWTIERVLYGLQKGKVAYQLPAGTVDVLNLLYRTLFSWTGTAYSPQGGTVANAFDHDIDTFCQQVTPNGNMYADFGVDSPLTIATIGIMPYGNNTYSLVWEWSTDLVTWTAVASQSAIAMIDKQWYYYDVAAPQEARYFRVRETNGATLAVRELIFGWNETEIPIMRSNRDDYSSLPNKTFQSRLPTEYWYNRLLEYPEIVIWPAPSDFLVMMVAWKHRQIQDIGDLTNTIEFPQRWYDCVLANVSHRNSLDIPGVEPDRIDRLERLAMKAEEPPFDEERDKAPIYFTPNIGHYTGSRSRS